MASPIQSTNSLLNALQQSEARYRNLVENSSDWLWEVDAQGVYMYCSPRCIDILGYQPEELLGSTPFDLMPTQEAQRVRALFQQISQDKREIQALENTNIHKKGHLVILETSAIPFFNEAGELLGYRGIDRDMSVRKTTQAQLYQQAQIIDQTHGAIITTDMAGHITSWNKGAQDIFGLSSNQALDKHIGFIYLPTEQDYFQKQIVPHLQKYPSLESRIIMQKNSTQLLKTHLTASWQLNESRQPIGVIHFIKDITTQVNTEHALIMSEKNLETTLNCIADAVIVTDTRQCIQRMNPAAEELMQCTLQAERDQPVQHIFDHSNKHAAETITRLIDKVISEQSAVHLSFENCLTINSIKEQQVTLSAAPIIDEDKQISGVILVLHNVTGQYKTQRALYDSNQKFSALIAAMPDVAFVLDEEGRFLDIYGNEQHLLYCDVDNLLHNKVKDVLPEPLASQVMEMIHNTLSTGELQTLEYELEIALGLCYFEGRIVPMHNKTDEMRRIVWITRNISDKTQALKSLKASEKRFREIFEKMPNVAVQGYNNKREVIFWNNTSATLYGYTQQEALGRKLDDLIIPAAFKDETIEATNNFLYHDIQIPSGELELQHKDGTIVPVFSSHIKLGIDPEQAEMFCVDIDLSDIKKANHSIEQLAYFDPLTNLPNRRLFLDRLQQEQKKSKRNPAFSAILFLDLDNFKMLNDSLGHSVGDLLLSEVGQRMQNVIREADTVSRLGGDEFVVLLNELSADRVEAVKQVQHIAETVMLALKQPVKIQQHEHIITSSLGITLFKGDHDSADTLLKQADTAMYRAKNSGRNTARFFNPSMQVEADARLALEKDLRKALRCNELQLYYQPQYNSEGLIIGAEALLRWVHPKRGMVSPAEFIPVAEEAGLIFPIGQWVLSTACNHLKSWEQQGLHDDFHLAINVSPKQFRMQDFVAQIQRLLNNVSINTGHLVLELTEGVVIDDIQKTIDKIHALKKLGVGFSIDDFGTGYSSLVYLKQLPLDQLKIDKAFVHDIETASNDAAIVEAIISMARLLKMQVIAEGVETMGQLEFLQSHDCHQFQGYYFSKPLPEAIFTGQLLDMILEAQKKS